MGGPDRTTQDHFQDQDHSPDEGAAADLKPTGFEPIDWDARLRAAVEQTLEKQEARRITRAEFRARRDAGLQARHAEKLARNGVLPLCCREADTPPCPQHRQTRKATEQQGPRARQAPTRVVGESGKTRPAPERYA